MSTKKGQLLELTIEKMAFGGPGIAFLDGLVVFVAKSAPGDRVKARVYKKKRDYAEARIVEIIQPSPARITPPCLYYPFCGGCQWQHLAYEHQLKYKASLVAEALEKIAGINEPEIKPIIPSEELTGYRNKMEFSFSSRRWALPEELPLSKEQRSFALGLHLPGTFNKVIDVSNCLLQPQQANMILNMVKELARNSGLPPYDIKSHEGFWRYLTIRHSVAFDQWMVNVVTSQPNGPVMKALAGKLVEKIPNMKSIVNNVSRRKAGVAIGEYEALIWGEPTIKEKIGSYIFQISANSFFQTNTRGAQRLYQVVDRYTGMSGIETVLDLYCGTGTIALYLAPRAKKVIGIEINRAAVNDAKRNQDLNGIENVSFIQGDIRDQLPLLKQRPDIVIIDPPRAGIHKDVARQILETSAPKIIYVSCNPVTMARDLSLLAEAYELKEVQPVDMFPHTYHVEAVGLLALRDEKWTSGIGSKKIS